MEEPQARLECDLRLTLPQHAIFVGASQSGKTTLCLRLLSNIHLFSPKPARIIFYYDQFQDSYSMFKADLSSKGVEVLLFKGFNVPDLDNIDELTLGKETILLIDDFSEQTSASQEIARYATNGRHKHVSLWLIWHSLFSKNPASRIISQNIRYFFFLPSLRLESQLRVLGNQLGMKSSLISAFRSCVNQSEHGSYLLLDVGPATPPILRLRSRIEAQDYQFVFF